MNWKYFCAATVIVAAALLKYGAPLFPVLAGIVAVGAWTLFKARRTS
jgi:hypothetical protein